MSESIVRKVQPFTIGTKLSIPAVAKCPEFTDPFLPSQPLDNRKLPRNLNDRVSLFLGQARAQGGHAESRFSPVAARVAQVERQREEPTEEDDVNRNAVSPTVASRSIRKITISGSGETSGDVAKLPGARASPELEKINNNNNNNNIGVKGIPRIIGVTCENKPHSHFKVLLRKDAKDEQQSPTSQGGIGLQPSGDKANKAPVPRSASPRRCPPKRESPTSRNTAVLSGVKPVAAQTDCSFTKRNALFNKEVLQAEEWIKAKLRDLKDGCSVQRCPLQDWEQVSQTLQRDLKDFENNLIQLNQMGEQLVCWANPTSELVKKQLAQLREQWQALKQMAAGQARALGGARSLQEFNQKVDRLEVWIKEKQEEEQSLVKGLGENIDKMQLTRRILDLKQDEPHYRALHEEINHLALKLEKQSKTESKNISVRRKHINKMWLKVQTLLKDYHESLQLALEVSSFYQQADSILCAISDKGKSICAPDDCGSSGDREIRDIASQIMMLDVTVSQLSNLHPALASRVVQKQSEVRDAWAVLQKAIRKEKPIPPSPGSDFTREDGDPATPTGESQGSVGTETLRIMGKEVKEEQNRLKGCVGARDVGSGEMPVDSQEAEAFPRSCATQVPGSGSGHADDVIRKSQAEGERAVPKETKPGVAAARGQSQLYTQLQKFTVSADKTLTWLKNNVAMATHICCTANLDGFEAAKRCQAALEEEILSNGARIEVVKKEGRSLVRAQHPGSAKIEEFLGQLEALWEELKRRHQRNVVVLQESEKLNLKAMNVLKDLNTLETWLQSVECSIRQSSLAGDPESMSAAERESCLLEREVSSRGLELCVLRQEVDKLRCRRHAHAERLPARMAEVEEKYRSVHSALTQQSAELQDTRMLTEFLERVELEEGQALHGSHGDNPGQPLQPDLEERPSLTGPAGVPLMEDIGDPVEELREAVVMLNDTARERGRSLSQDQGIQELLSRYSSLGVRIQQGLSRSEELSGIVQEAETDMAVKCEPHRCGLHRLREQQDELEVDYEVLREDVEEARRSAAWLQVLCPDRMHALDGEARATLQAWEKLGTAMAENRARLQNFARLQDFFQNYLAMISWTEDTRARIFDNVGHRGSASQEPTVTELDLMIEQKFEEFDVLAAAGQELIDEEHHLTNMIRERTEELQSMLGWILVRWRAQKHQWHLGKPKLEPKEDVIYSEATVCTPAQQSVSPHCGTQQTAKVAAAGDTSGRREGCGWEQSESGYEVMGSISPNEKGSGAGSPAETHQDPMAIETSRSPFLVMKEPSAPALGGTVNLILSFSKMGDSQLQVQEAMEEAEVTEPVHRGQSMSLFSVHMGLEEDRCPAIGSDCDRDEHGKTTSPGRRCNSMNGRKPEFQSMEGTLERKHKLQLGGKRAPCRAWSTYHAILFRQTLCFYQDRKDTLKSSVAGLPLNVTGAECVPVPEYSKRANCFSLRLRDGSEYLLSASSRFLMKKWMLKIQANSVLSEADPPRPLHPASVEDRTLETGGVVPTSPSGCSQAGTAKGKEIVVLPRDSTQIPDGHRRNLQDLSSASSPHKGYYYGSLRPRLPQSPPETAPSIPRTSSPSSKRRSHSFTSATYQKITPVTMPPGSRDGGSSYTVTLFIRDQLSEAEPASSGPDLASATSLTQGPLTDSPHGRSYASLPWPRNKSVFKKFFGKRE
ncbi:spectrin beta chain, non-erythrocytic 5 isoform X4 [Brienomyrus brachyistius]|uniref:spectrin beta chain, non-erythrocytic 5 isoform X4 n=1 Tax=Brienomyrus brachyistius TaxID=42636 RepID=UPI0020B1B23B|nr:spectrin beta chain, non-erythrocytic 5 isoform X4 [Brienomyrus brachyistius]